MREEELLQKLNNLKSIAPETNWKSSVREILLSQISGQENEDVKLTAWQRFFGCQFFEWVSQPVVIVGAIILFLVGGTTGSLVIAQSTKPGDSLYIAKLISERTRTSFTFDEKEKVKLNMEFASNRIREIEQILAEPNKPAEETVKKVDDLEKNFKQEIASAKSGIEKIEKNKTAKTISNPRVETKPPVAVETSNPVDNKKEEPSKIFSANLGKTNEGMQVAEGQKESIEPEKTVSQPEINQTFGSTTKAIIDEAETLINSKDYKTEDITSKLNEAIASLSDTSDNKGEVKGVTESASSTK